MTLRFLAEGARLKAEYVVAPGCDAGAIGLSYPDASAVEIRGDGSLATRSPDFGDMVEQKPQVYQQIGGKHAAVAGKYVRQRGGSIGFQVGRYDRSLPLIIDPVLVFSASPGGSGIDQATGVSRDASGNIYVTGWTDSPTFSSAVSPFPRSLGVDAFVMKLDPRANLVYLTYLAGNGADRALGIAATADGYAWVCGMTTSSDFPVVNAQQTQPAGGQDAFLVKLDPTGTNLVFSTYYGGGGNDSANAVAVDRAGNAYITGETTSVNLGVLTPLQALSGGGADTFVAKFSPLGRLIYATYVGGSGNDRGLGIAVDPLGSAYITGSTESFNFPVSMPIQANKAGGQQDAFIAKLNPAGTALVYSTYLGGSGGSVTTPEQGNAIAVDVSGSAYVVGSTNSNDFPIVSALQKFISGVDTDAFVTRIDSTGTKLLYSTYLGGTSVDVATGVVLDTSGNAYVSGYTGSFDFPLVQPIQATLGGWLDAFLAKISSTGKTLLFSTVLGGQQIDSAAALAGVNDTILVGATSSTDLFPGTAGVNTLILDVRGVPNAPFGFVDTPTNGATGLSGAVAIGGWALCEDQMPAVTVWRDPIPGESGLVYVANGLFLPGSRPDIVSAFPAYPYNDRGGWGLQLLTNTLPNSSGSGTPGNGTFKFHVLAQNLQGQSVELGQKTLTVDNANSTIPFGAIDTPAPGATISGKAYINFGWVLTPLPASIPADGSSIYVFIDGVSKGHPVYNNFRSDVASLFPSLKNANGAVGYFSIDTTVLTNGVHTISWFAADTAGHVGSMGSRYFSVQN